MPLTLVQFLLTIPIMLAIGISPFLIYRLIKREPLKELLLVYFFSTAALVGVFFFMALYEQMMQ